MNLANRGHKAYNTGAMDSVAEIKARISIEDLVAQYVPLKKVGRNFTRIPRTRSRRSPRTCSGDLPKPRPANGAKSYEALLPEGHVSRSQRLLGPAHGFVRRELQETPGGHAVFALGSRIQAFF